MKTVKDYLNAEWNENSGHITKKAILKASCDRIGSYETYIDIEGSYMAVYSYWEHNVENFIVSENEKWVGYELEVGFERSQWLYKNYGRDTIRLIVPQWVMNMKVDSEFHASNLFRKYLRLL